MTHARALLLLVAVAGCGGKGSITLISCGNSGALCDTTSGKACCVSSTAATCTSTCTGSPTFYCLGPTTCNKGERCCASDLGSHCATDCSATEQPACDLNADCLSTAPSCNPKTYTAAGKPIFTIEICGAAP